MQPTASSSVLLPRGTFIPLPCSREDDVVEVHAASTDVLASNRILDLLVASFGEQSKLNQLTLCLMLNLQNRSWPSFARRNQSPRLIEESRGETVIRIRRGCRGLALKRAWRL